MTTQSPGKKNAVIMGRKTWFSIPEKMRPLCERINIVLSTTQMNLEGPDFIADSFQKAMKWLHSPSMKEKVDKIFVIGGEAVYKIAMDSDYHQIIYLTRIHNDFECDAFFPHMDPEKYSLTEPEDVPDGIQEENGVKYKHEVYVKNEK
ncbi:dihydrofolate reductase [Caerostris darwini]|uniref:dihydrofolate reductase n=1 Tax=Caerostris darwini TaxID=1538125 RepID=A0AAV4WU10_9ARAC|nr:dihydrofolate reductase [Caerostris darwini]